MQLLVLGAVLLLAWGCYERFVQTPRPALRILTYNVENLFDAQYDGREYPRYDPRKRSGDGRAYWDQRAYEARLKKLASLLVLLAAKPDIICLQEVEHSGVVDDLISRYLSDYGYSYRVCTTSAGSTQIALISKHPIRQVRTVDTEQKDAAQDPVDADVSAARTSYKRPLLVVDVAPAWADTPLRLAIMHWSSQKGGRLARLSRRAQARVLQAELVRAEAEGIELLAIGDANTPQAYLRTSPEALEVDAADPLYDAVGRCATDARGASSEVLAPVLRLTSLATAKPHTMLYSPWLGENIGEGSYNYRGQWQQLDQVLVPWRFFDKRRWDYDKTRLLMRAEMLNEDGSPKSYARDKGYSDHLPLIAYLWYYGS